MRRGTRRQVGSVPRRAWVDPAAKIGRKGLKQAQTGRNGQKWAKMGRKEKNREVVEPEGKLKESWRLQCGSTAIRSGKMDRDEDGDDPKKGSLLGTIC